MPKISVWGDQSPTEFLNNLFENKHFWNFKSFEKVQISKLCILGSITTDKLKKISKKFITKFNIIGCPDLSE